MTDTQKTREVATIIGREVGDQVARTLKSELGQMAKHFSTRGMASPQPMGQESMTAIMARMSKTMDSVDRQLIGSTMSNVRGNSYDDATNNTDALLGQILDELKSNKRAAGVLGSKGVKPSGGLLGGILGDLLSKLGGFLTGLGALGIVGSLLAGLISGQPQFFDMAGKLAANAVSRAANALRPLMKVAGEAFTKLGKFVTPLFRGMKNVAASIIEHVGGFVGKLVKGLHPEKLLSKLALSGNGARLMGAVGRQVAKGALSPERAAALTANIAKKNPSLLSKVASKASAIGGALKPMLEGATKFGGKAVKNAGMVAKVGGKLGLAALKNIPLLGSIVGLWFMVDKVRKGDIVGAGLELVGAILAIPGLTIAWPIQIALNAFIAFRDIQNEKNDLYQEKAPLPKIPPIVLRNIPLIGSIFRFKDGIEKFKNKDYIGGLADIGFGVATLAPGAGYVVGVISDMVATFGKDTGVAKALDGLKQSVNDIIANNPLKSIVDGITKFLSDRMKDVLGIKDQMPKGEEEIWDPYTQHRDGTYAGAYSAKMSQSNRKQVGRRKSKTPSASTIDTSKWTKDGITGLISSVIADRSKLDNETTYSTFVEMANNATARDIMFGNSGILKGANKKQFATLGPDMKRAYFNQIAGMLKEGYATSDITTIFEHEFLSGNSGNPNDGKHASNSNHYLGNAMDTDFKYDIDWLQTFGVGNVKNASDADAYLKEFRSMGGIVDDENTATANRSRHFTRAQAAYVKKLYAAGKLNTKYVYSNDPRTNALRMYDRISPDGVQRLFDGNPIFDANDKYKLVNYSSGGDGDGTVSAPSIMAALGLMKSNKYGIRPRYGLMDVKTSKGDDANHNEIAPNGGGDYNSYGGIASRGATVTEASPVQSVPKSQPFKTFRDTFRAMMGLGGDDNPIVELGKDTLKALLDVMRADKDAKHLGSGKTISVTVRNGGGTGAVK